MYELKAKREGGVRTAVFSQKTVFTFLSLWILLSQGVSLYIVTMHLNLVACLLLLLTMRRAGLPGRKVGLGPLQKEAALTTTIYKYLYIYKNFDN